MTLTVLGCSGSYAGPGDACSGYLVRSGETNIWIDTGPGTLANLQRFIAPAELTAVVVSHQHPDHFGDLPVFYNVCRFFSPITTIPVFTTAGVRELVDHISEDASDAFEWNVITDADEVTIGGVTVRFSRTDHPVETLAARVAQNGRSLAYSADTGPGWSLAELGDPVDVAIVEATMSG